MDEIVDQEESEVESQELFKPKKKSFFNLLFDSFKFFTLNLPAIATIVIPVYLIVEFLVPLLSMFVDNLAEGLTGWSFIDDFLSWVIEYITIEFLRQLVGGIAWIAVIRVIAGAMHGDKIQSVQAIKDGTTMLPMYFVTAVIFYSLLIISSLLLLVPGIIFAVYCAFWQYSYVLRGKGAFSALAYSYSLVKDDFVRVFLNVFGIILLLFVFDYFILESLSNVIASTLDSEEGFVYDIVNAIMMALGKVFEVGIEIIFLMMLFMALEEEDTEINN
tara:strand:+ start:92 stop:913 length:822 start_codon:yes stop_codon:yes gene_type:complete